MRKQVFSVLVCLLFATQLSAQYAISGKVVSESGEALQGASISVKGASRGTISNANGNFELDDLSGEVSITISYIGYETQSKSLSLTKDTDLGEIVLFARYFAGEEVTISAVSADEFTPVAYTNISGEEIAARNVGQDIPYILSMTPSLVSSSDAGHGIGYTAMRIRGSDGNRINVTVNGIPLNDAESHGVYWVDLPDLASSAEKIQVQRGVGTSTNGAGAFGASVNIQTDDLNEDPYVNYAVTAGSFNTLKNTLSLGSGIIGNGFALDLRLSDIYSGGFIDRSWTDLQSYYISAGYYQEKSSLKFITFGGFEELYQAWGGVPSTMLDSDRTYNYMGEYLDSAGQVQYYDKQVDHYDQVHYQLHFSHMISNQLQLNAALHYTRGIGYYEEYETDADFSYYSMSYPRIGSDTVFSTDLVRQKWLDNDFYGFIASAKYTFDRGSLVAGGGWNQYVGDHFGKVIWARYFGENEPGHQWYFGSGSKKDWNIYGKYYYQPLRDLTAFIDLQVRGIEHIMEGQDANNRTVDQEHAFIFFNPKAGLTYSPGSGQRTFLSYARANREPNRNNYTDAPVGREPVKETLNDFEAGYSVARENYTAGVTLYYMDYNNQLVLTGEINEVGYPVMTNVAESFRAGIELEGGIKIQEDLLLQGNLSLSRNRILDFTNYIDNWDYWNDPENEAYQIEEVIGNSSLAYSPEILAATSIEYEPMDNLSFKLTSKYVGEQFIDNTSNRNYMIDSYFVSDLKVSYEYNPGSFDKIIFSVLVANLLDEKYETNAWLYRYYSDGEEQAMDGFYPQAGRYFMLSMAVKF